MLRLGQQTSRDGTFLSDYTIRASTFSRVALLRHRLLALRFHSAAASFRG